MKSSFFVGRRGRDRMVVGFTIAIGVHHHWCCGFDSRSGRGVQHYMIKFVSDLRWFSLGPPLSSTNKTDRHSITEILLEMALNTIKPINQPFDPFYVLSINISSCACFTKNKRTINNLYLYIWTPPFWQLWASWFFCVYFWSTKKPRKFVGDHPMNIPARFGSNWPSGLRKEDSNVKLYWPHCRQVSV